ncbi:MAG: hypothetical protein DRP01_02435 [Archaeoglobales archaeon]|nr:MAG: hypothetical protein DRP01_02435 [Archaeoglobales archaeon]
MVLMKIYYRNRWGETSVGIYFTIQGAKVGMGKKASNGWYVEAIHAIGPDEERKKAIKAITDWAEKQGLIWPPRGLEE